jgi:hypothetical protein
MAILVGKAVLANAEAGKIDISRTCLHKTNELLRIQA